MNMMENLKKRAHTISPRTLSAPAVKNPKLQVTQYSPLPRGIKCAGVEPSKFSFALVAISKLEDLLHKQCLTSGCMAHVIEEDTTITYQGSKSLQ